jgi:hypothetical protein
MSQNFKTEYENILRLEGNNYWLNEFS